MITGKTIQVDCFKNLLETKSTGNKIEIESIECLAKLLMVVGKKLEKEAAEIAANKTMFDSCFSLFKELATGRPFFLKSECLQFSEGFVFIFSFYRKIQSYYIRLES